eukprot:g12848.t1
MRYILKHNPVSITGEQARLVASGFAHAYAEADYNALACAILPNHAHLVIARQERPIEKIAPHLKSRATRRLNDANNNPLPRSPWAKGPADLARLAVAAGLDGYSLTDHDTTAGLKPAADAAKKVGLAFIPGIELSIVADPFAEASPLADDGPTDMGSIHLLGYHVRSDSEPLTIIETKLRRARETRNPQIIEKLAEQGVRIDYQDVLDLARAGSEENLDEHAVGRPHIAQVLVQRGYVKSMHEAFAQYLGQGGAAYVPRELPTADKAIAAIHAAGGVAVLAHPVHLGLSKADLEHHAARLADLGLDGIETHHPDHEPGDTKQLTALAEQFGLLTTGGSDYHGSRKAIALGSVVAPGDTLERLQEAAAQYGENYRENTNMHMKASGKQLGPKSIPVTFELEDPESLNQTESKVEVKGALGQSLLELALENDIAIEHACGGVCACSTCHVHVDQGEDAFNEPEDEELDRVEEAPGNDFASRLSCQAKIQSADEPIIVRVPAWNRNAVKEVPH